MDLFSINQFFNNISKPKPIPSIPKLLPKPKPKQSKSYQNRYQNHKTISKPRLKTKLQNQFWFWCILLDGQKFKATFIL
jgi:hypothetical protein